MTTSPRRLHYVADPMCSWCWGFHSELEALRTQLPTDLVIDYVMGGLAVDSEESMPLETRSYVQQAWREVESRTAARFNWDFWESCEPRRSTYPACRAVIAASFIGPREERAMFEAIQRAYYLEARNPSLDSTLIELAGELGLSAESFADELRSERTEQVFKEHRDLRRSLGANSFPSLVLTHEGDEALLVMQGAGTAADILARL